MCWCNDLFQIQSVHLQRITGPDGHRMNNATPAEGQSAIRFAQKGNIGEKNNLAQKQPKRESKVRAACQSVLLTWELFNLPSWSNPYPILSLREKMRWAWAQTGVPPPVLCLYPFWPPLPRPNLWNPTRLALNEAKTRNWHNVIWIFFWVPPVVQGRYTSALSGSASAPASSLTRPRARVKDKEKFKSVQSDRSWSPRSLKNTVSCFRPEVKNSRSRRSLGSGKSSLAGTVNYWWIFNKVEDVHWCVWLLLKRQRPSFLVYIARWKGESERETEGESESWKQVVISQEELSHNVITDSVNIKYVSTKSHSCKMSYVWSPLPQFHWTSTPGCNKNYK